jgi:hypothetical protein
MEDVFPTIEVFLTHSAMTIAIAKIVIYVTYAFASHHHVAELTRPYVQRARWDSG